MKLLRINACSSVIHKCLLLFVQNRLLSRSFLHIRRRLVPYVCYPLRNSESLDFDLLFYLLTWWMTISNRWSNRSLLLALSCMVVFCLIVLLYLYVFARLHLVSLQLNNVSITYPSLRTYIWSISAPSSSSPWFFPILLTKIESGANGFPVKFSFPTRED
jgi:hypothetical protein